MKYKKQNIKTWAVEDRPREKLLLKGRSSLSNAELVAILINTGTKNNSALDLAKEVLNLANNNLVNLGKKSISEFGRIKGVGQAKALKIVAALELGRRRQLANAEKRKQIQKSTDAFEYLQPIIGDLQYEEFWILLLNRNNKIIGTEKISKGGIVGTVTDKRIIFKLAIDAFATSIILAHNHPSGNTKPSEADRKITQQLRSAGKIMDVEVLDHLIITNDAYFSFADEGFM